ncbi:hypothetical protein ACFY3U_14500 [Micromonospora sp. NPDC000089]|uniref:hypothetical protein n=1 Tax=unclassified Micromonospora TaxID=2617518 RepID=UPI0036AE2DBF
MAPVEAARAALRTDRDAGLLVSRRWLFAAVESWWQTSSKLLALIGPPGTGKTWAALQLASTEDPPRAASVPIHATHFYGADRLSASFKDVVSRLSEQLLNSLDGYPDATLACRETTRVTYLNPSVGSVGDAATVTMVGRLGMSQLDEPKEYLDRLLVRPLKWLDAHGALPSNGVVLLLSGIDEATGWNGVDLSQILLEGIHDVPGLRLIVTSQRITRPLLHADQIHLDSEPGRADVEEYLRQRLARHGHSPERIRHLARLSGTNLLVAHYAANDIDGLPSPTDGRPVSLSEMYETRLRRYVEARSEYRPRLASALWDALGVVAQAQGSAGLPQRIVEEALRTLTRDQAEGDVKDALDACRGLLTLSPDRAVVPYHDSFRQFLVTPLPQQDGLAQPPTDPQRSHLAIATALARRWRRPQPDEPATERAYLVRHLLDHVTGALPARAARTLARSLATDPAFLDRVIRGAGAEWLLHQLDRLADGSDENEPDIDQVTLITGLQVRHLGIAGLSAVPGRPLQQLLLQARLSGATAFADTLAAELTRQEMDALFTVWTVGRRSALPGLHRLPHPRTSVHRVVFTPDGLAVTAAGDGMVRAWAVPGGGIRWQHRLAEVAVRAVTVIDQGRVVAAGADDGTIAIWYAETGEPLGGTRVAPRVDLLAAVPASDEVIIGADREVLVWAPTSGRDPELLVLGPSRVVTALPDPHGRVLTAFSDGTAQIWSKDSGAMIAELGGTPVPWSTAVLTPGWRWAVLGGRNGELRRWTMSAPDEVVRLGGMSARVTAAVCHATEQVVRLVVGDAAGDVQVWNVEWEKRTRRLTAESGPAGPGADPDERGKAHRAEVTWIGLDATGRQALTTSRDGEAALWELGRDSRTLTLLGDGGELSGGALTADGRYAVASSLTGEARVWLARAAGDLTPQTGHRGRVTAAEVAVDRPEVVSASADGTARLWDLASGDLRRVLEHGSPVRAVATMPGGRVLTGGDDGVVLRWTPDNTASSRLATGSGAVITILTSSGHGPVIGFDDGAVLVGAGSRTGPVRLAHGGPLTALSLTPDGGTMVSAGSDHRVAVWDLAAARERHRLNDHEMTTVALALTADGQLLATASLDGSVRVWDLRTGDCRHVLTDPSAPPISLTSVAFFGGDHRLATGYEDGTVRLWTVEDGQLLPDVLIHSGAVTALTTLSGGQFVTGSADGSVAVWRIRGSGTETRLSAHLSLDAAVSCIAPAPGPAGGMVVGTTNGQLAHLRHG